MKMETKLEIKFMLMNFGLSEDEAMLATETIKDIIEEERIAIGKEVALRG